MAEPRRVAFQALIKELNVKSLVTGDKEARLVVQFNAENSKTLNSINRLHRADKLVYIVIVDKEGALEADD